jgi:hypothetical protein
MSRAVILTVHYGGIAIDVHVDCPHHAVVKMPSDAPDLVLRRGRVRWGHPGRSPSMARTAILRCLDGMEIGLPFGPDECPACRDREAGESAVDAERGLGQGVSSACPT